jgi:hypothetical protein
MGSPRDRLCLSLALFAFGCSERASLLLPARNSQESRDALVVHEWGTYTSLEGSDGRTVDGLQHTEEPLPAFVHARDPNAAHTKGVEAIPEPVNQKLETPVLYFHSAVARSVRVTVDFPKGIISEWYPNASSFSPAVGALDALARGSMTWTGDLLTQGTLGPDVPSDSVWAPSRKVAAAGVRIAGEQEGFIFYRGLARFDMAVHVESQADGSLAMVNASGDDIPAMFLLSASGQSGGVRSIGALPARATKVVSLDLALEPLDAYVRDASDRIRTALEGSGLFADEAQAMVDTWSRSYFQTGGTRVLYIAPRTWTDALLPIAIDPPPDALVRTLVGRIEIMTPEEEQSIKADLEEAAAGRLQLGIDAYRRFTEPKLRRAAELIEDPEVKAFASVLVEEAATTP